MTTQTLGVEGYLERISPSRRRVLEVLMTEHPSSVEIDSIPARADVGPGSVRKHLSLLRADGMIEYPRPGYAIASATAMIE